MNRENILEHFLETTFFVEGNHDYEAVKKTLRHPKFPDKEREFKEDLRNAVNLNTYTVAEFERIAYIEFETQDEVREFLIDQIWKPLYGDEPFQA